MIGYEKIWTDTWKLYSSLYQLLLQRIRFEKVWTDNIPYSLRHFQPPLSDKGAVDNTIGLYTEISKLFLSQQFAVRRKSSFIYCMPCIRSRSCYEEPYLKVRLLIVGLH